MGKRKYDPSAHAQVRQQAAASGNTGFDWGTRTGQDSIHQALHPAYGGLRLSNDYDTGEQAFPISVLMDFTGSNIEYAKRFYERLGEFMTLLTVQGWVKGKRPQVQVLGMDDYEAEPEEWAQISQFEPDGVTLDKWIGNMKLTGNGGGNGVESYEEMFWFLNHLNKLQAWERGEKGKLFILFDEAIRPMISASAIQHIMGLTINQNNPDLSPNMQAKTSGIQLPKSNINTDDEVKLLLKNYDVWCFIDKRNSYAGNAAVQKTWTSRFPERVIYLPDAEDGVYMAAGLIGQSFGVPVAQVQSQLKTLGAGADTVKALAVAAQQSGIMRVNNNPNIRRIN